MLDSYDVGCWLYSSLADELIDLVRDVVEFVSCSGYTRFNLVSVRLRTIRLNIALNPVRFDSVRLGSISVQFCTLRFYFPSDRIRDPLEDE